MRNDPVWSSSPVETPAVTLNRVWRVDADATYRIGWPRGLGAGLVAVRTLAGRGRMRVQGEEPFELVAGSLAILAAADVRHYACDGSRWRFWWLEFSGSPPNLPMHRALEVPLARHEGGQMQTCFDLLRRDTPAASLLASATLASLLADWAYRWPEADQPLSPDARRVERAIHAMRESLTQPLSVEHLAAAAGLGPRRFRQVFREVTGQTPKRYYDALRLSLAAELLRMGGLSVTQVAEQLGYSSPFHFSRAFKMHFAQSPSAYRRQ